jgi:hypothetical protein
MRHVVVTRFSVPRPQDPENANRHNDRAWLDARLELFHRFFVPSVGRLGVPAVLLCSTESASHVAAAVRSLEWVEVMVQDEWYGGWSGEADQMVTRMDSDDAIHEDWLVALEAVPASVEAVCTREFLRYDPSTEKLSSYIRREPSPLAAFPGGRNPFAYDHAEIDRHCRVHEIEGAFLLQIFHGCNLSTRRPSWYRRRLPLSRLEAFGVTPPGQVG